MRWLGQFLSGVTWLLVAGSVIILAGGLFGRPLLLAAVPTGSMVPVLQPGDLIVVLPTWLTGPAGLNDITVFKTPGSPHWIVHRVVDGNSTEGFVTRGDANPTADAERVLPAHVAGIVPQWDGAALRIPRMGLLSSGGPFSNPVVAGVALAMGVFLLVLDASPRVRGASGVARPRGRARPEQLLGMYLGLTATAFITTLIPAWTLSAQQTVGYEVVAQKHANDSRRGQYLVGVRHTDRIAVKNPSPLPLVVTFQAERADIRYAPTWVLIPGGQERQVQLTINTDKPGRFETVVRSGVFMPVLPPAWLGWLAHISLPLTAVAGALVPSAAVMGLALLDTRIQPLLYRWRVRLLRRFV